MALDRVAGAAYCSSNMPTATSMAAAAIEIPNASTMAVVIIRTSPTCRSSSDVSGVEGYSIMASRLTLQLAYQIGVHRFH